MWREHIFVDNPHFLTRTMFSKQMFFLRMVLLKANNMSSLCQLQVGKKYENPN